MWICKNCGAENNGNFRFCSGCGMPKSEVELPVEDSPEAAWAPPAPEAAYPPAENWAPAAEAAYPGGYAAPPAGGWGAPPPVKKKSHWWIWLLAVLVLLAAAAAVCYFTVHIWTPATCTEAQVCKICGKHQGIPLGHSFSEATCTEPATCTRCGLRSGEALGHDWHAATCTEPATCSRCGATQGEPLGHNANAASCTEPSYCTRCGEKVSDALGHDWQPATYDAPETCARCGETRGDVKGYIGNLSGSMSSETYVLYGNNESHAYVLNTPVHSGLYMCLGIEVTSYSGSPWGTWGVYGRDTNGNWQLLTTFYVSKSVYNNWTEYDLYLDGKTTFDALTIVPQVDADYSISFSFAYLDVQEYIG